MVRTDDKMMQNVKKAAEFVIRQNVHSACFWLLYQPKLSKKCIDRFK